MPTLNEFNSKAPTFIARVPLKQSPRFTFVTISNPKEIKDSTKQYTIRRHARREADRAKRALQNSKFKNRNVEPQHDRGAELLLNEKHTQSANDAVYPSSEYSPGFVPTTSLEQLNSKSVSLDFLKPLGAGRGFNPFAPYPVEPNSRTVQLLDYLWESGGFQQRLKQAIWITIGISDVSAFNITLASASLALAQGSHQVAQETTESTEHYTASVRAIGKRLQDPVEGISDGVIGTVLGFACLDITVRNWDRWQLHMSGAQRIIQLRGGPKALQTSHILQATAFWIDVTGALVHDIAPRFPLPQYAAPTLESHDFPRMFTFSQQWNTKFPNLPDISTTLTLLANLASHLNNQKTRNGMWQEEMLISHHVHPVAHELLSLPRHHLAAKGKESSSESIIREILRLTALLFIGLLKAHCNVFPSGVSENKIRLSSLITTVTVDWSSFTEIHLWVLTLSALAETGDRSWYIREIAEVMALLGLASWDEAVEVLKEMIWIGEMLDEDAFAIGRELSDFRLGLVPVEITDL